MIQIIWERYKFDRKKIVPFLKHVALKLKLKGRIVFRIGDSEESRGLNLTYRGKNHPTDVLSFPLHEKLPDGYYIGDILVCFPLVVTQAAQHRHSLERELLVLMIHGLLHLAGYDHETDQGQMYSLQTELLSEIPEDV